MLNDLYRFHSLVVGPGLGREDHTVPSVTKLVIDAIVPVVVDGDGLFALAWNEHGAPTMLLSREVPTILTARRRVRCSPATDRATTASPQGPATGGRHGRDRAAERTDDGRAAVGRCPTRGERRSGWRRAGRAMLAGIIGALAATGIDVLAARAAGAWLHAAAASFGPPRFRRATCWRIFPTRCAVGLTAPMDGCE